MSTDVLAGILAMAVCIVLSAYFSATETAFSSLNKTRIKAMAEKGDRRAELTHRLAEDYDRLISTILIGNNIVNIAVASIGTLLFVEAYGDIGATLSTVVVTIVVLIFGEITPKSIAKDFPERFAMFSAPYINIMIRIIAPLNFLFTRWKKFVSKLFSTEKIEGMSQDELLLLLDSVQQEGQLDETEGRLLRNAVEFGDLTAKDILTPRVDLEAVEVCATKRDIARTFTMSGFSRLLVYDGSLDDIVGVINRKDFYRGGGITKREISEIIAKPVFVQPGEKIDDLLRLLQENQAHLAVVVDEYGGTEGIVTVEDILEELVGDIWDEHDEVEEPFSKQEDGSFIVSANVSVGDFCDYFDIEVESDSVSLGGWITECMERIPEEGSSFEYGPMTVKVEKANKRRVELARVMVREEAAISA